MIGFVATQVDSAGREAGIPLLLVSPEKQRRGIGTQLHTAAIQHLRAQSVETISLAHGGGDYFWPGVPLDPPGTLDFFRSCGWDFPDINYDLTQDLSRYQTPPGVMERVTPFNIRFHSPSLDEIPAVLDFESRVFPFWAQFFASTAASGRLGDILAAWDGTTVVGSLLLDTADVEGLAPNSVWHQILGDDLGNIGAVGVDESYRERGIGLALMATASEILRERGVHQCIVGWTDLLTFYGRLGYKIWRAYAMTDN